MLDALRALGPILHPNVVEMWDSSLPKLAAYLDRMSLSLLLPLPISPPPYTLQPSLLNWPTGKGVEWQQSAWEDLVLRLTAETIKAANDAEWTCALAEMLPSQFEFYKGDEEMKVRRKKKKKGFP